MSEDTFDIGLTGLLIVFGGWYGLQMYAAPANAGRVPAIVAAVVLVALFVQLTQQLRRRRSAAGEADEPGTDASAATNASARASDMTEASSSNEPEPDTYHTLIALDAQRRRRLLIVALFSLAFYLGVVLVGFVITSGVLIFLIYRISGERLRTAVIGGVVGTSAVYALVVWVLNLPAVRGTLIN